ncbi:MAG: InlB B-repeat-containing protein [Eubacteriales bacterium]|nr:InlB B-repeat-containing protein [Eubacteriales bacterium]
MKGVWKRTLSCLMAVIFLFSSMSFTILAEEGYTEEGTFDSTGDIQGQEQYTVNVKKTGKGTITPEGDQAVLSGSTLSIMMTPDYKYKVAQIKVDGNPISEEEVAAADSAGQYDLIVSADQTVEVIFGAELSVSGHTFTVVGSEKLCGKEQDPEAYQNDMAESDTEIGTFTMEYKHVPMGNYSFKISKNHSTTEFYADGSTVDVPADDATVLITFKEDTQQVTTEVRDAQGNVISTGQTESTMPEAEEPQTESTAPQTEEPQTESTAPETEEWMNWETESLTIPENGMEDPQNMATVTITQNENGSILPEGWNESEKPFEFTAEEGTEVTFIITPAEGYYISGIVADYQEVNIDDLPNGDLEGQKKYTFSDITGIHSIDAAFLPKEEIPETESDVVKEEYKIQVLAGANGSIVPGGTQEADGNYYVTANKGDFISFDIVPDANYEISKVTIDGAEVELNTLARSGETGKVYTFSDIADNHTIAAEFTEIQAPVQEFKIEVTAGTNGTMNPAGDLGDDGKYYVKGTAGETISFEILPNEGCYISRLTVDGTDVDVTTLEDTGTAGKIYRFSDLAADHTISAEFKEIPHPESEYKYRIQVSVGQNGTITPSGEQGDDGNYYVTGQNAEDISFEVIPQDGYYISALIVDTAPVDIETLPDTADGKGKIYTFAQADGDHIISAEFEQIPASTYQIHVVQSSNGTIQPAGDAEGYVEANAGEGFEFTIIPDNGYKVVSVVADGVEYKADTLPDGTNKGEKIYRFDTVTHDSEIYAVFEAEQTEPTIYTIQASAGEGGIIEPSGEVEVKKGESQTFVMRPNEGYTILSVEINGQERLPEDLEDGPEPGTKQYTFENVSANNSIKVNFKANQEQYYKVTSSAGENGTVSPLGEQSVLAGDSITFTIQPNEGYHIDIVKVDGKELAGDELAAVKANQSYTFANVTQEHTLGVTFAEDSQPIKTYEIQASAGEHGVIAPEGILSVQEGDSAVFKITPDSGYHISDVFVDGTRVIGAELAHIVNTGTYTFVNVNRNHTIEVLFEQDGAPVIYHTIISSAGKYGTISPYGATTVINEDNQTYVITPDRGYRIASVMIDGTYLTGTALERVQNSKTYTFYDVTQDHSISVGFAKIVIPVTTYKIESFAGANGSITPNGAVQVEKGASQTYQIQAAPGYHLAVVKIDGIELTGNSLKQVQNTGLYTFSNVAANHTIGVAFEQNENPVLQYNVTYLNEDGSPIENLDPIYSNYKTYIYGNGLILPTVAPYARTGYNFLGWYTAMTGGEKVEAISTRDSGDKVVYARWSQNAIPMVFDDKESGIMLSGNFNGSPKLWVVALNPGNKTYEELKAVPAMTGKKPIGAFDISIIDGTFSGTMVLTFAVNEGYNGKTLTVIHKNTDGTIEVFTPVASNGKIAINVDDLGSFMLAANDADYLMYGPNSSVKTGDSMATTFAASGVMMVLCAGVILVLLARKKEHHK